MGYKQQHKFKNSELTCEKYKSAIAVLRQAKENYKETENPQGGDELLERIRTGERLKYISDYIYAYRNRDKS